MACNVSLLWYPLSATASCGPSAFTRSPTSGRLVVHATSAMCSPACGRVSRMVWVSPAAPPDTVTATTAPVSRFTACSALYARWVRPSFSLAISASGSCGFTQSSFDPLFTRLRSSLASCSRVGVSIPDSFASRRRNSSYSSPVSRRTIDRIAALASRVVPSMPTVFPFSSPFSANNPRIHRNTAWWVSTSINRRVREIVE